MKCEICFKYKYKNITTLPECGHSMCSKCIKNIKTHNVHGYIKGLELLHYKNLDSTIKCPFCRGYYFFCGNYIQFIPLIIEFYDKDFIYIYAEEALWIFKPYKDVYYKLKDEFNNAKEKKITIFYKVLEDMELKPKYDENMNEITTYQFLKSIKLVDYINKHDCIMGYLYDYCLDGTHPIKDYINSKQLTNDHKMWLLNEYKDHLNTGGLIYLGTNHTPPPECIEELRKIHENNGTPLIIRVG